MIFVYRKDVDFKVLTLDESLKQESVLFESGYKHISTIDSEIMIKNIYEIVLGKGSSTEKLVKIEENLLK